jgi:hypothetical protein
MCVISEDIMTTLYHNIREVTSSSSAMESQYNIKQTSEILGKGKKQWKQIWQMQT